MARHVGPAGLEKSRTGSIRRVSRSGTGSCRRRTGRVTSHENEGQSRDAVRDRAGHRALRVRRAGLVHRCARSRLGLGRRTTRRRGAVDPAVALASAGARQLQAGLGATGRYRRGQTVPGVFRQLADFARPAPRRDPRSARRCRTRPGSTRAGRGRSREAISCQCAGGLDRTRPGSSRPRPADTGSDHARPGLAAGPRRLVGRGHHALRERSVERTTPALRLRGDPRAAHTADHFQVVLGDARRRFCSRRKTTAVSRDAEGRIRAALRNGGKRPDPRPAGAARRNTAPGETDTRGGCSLG